MENAKKIRVLVVDDSPLFRETIVREISSDEIEIAAVAANPLEARDRILETHPDVITCDVEMPFMDGIEFVRQLLPQYYVPVVMVSSVSNKVFEALKAGAVDFVVKPDQRTSQSMDTFVKDLIQKIRIASSVKTPALKQQKAISKVSSEIIADTGKIIAIGASTGGTEAIFSILSALPPTIPGIVIAQHIPAVFSRMFAERLNKQTALMVKEAATGDTLSQGTVLIAPGDKHMKVKKIGNRFQVECFLGEKVNGHCPSVDVLFDSVAKEAGSSSVGIILTGMGYDGAKGLLNIRRKGGRTIGQDKASSVVYGMPKVAYDIGAVEIQTALSNMPLTLYNVLK